MTTVVDTNVLIDILSGSAAEIKAAENAVHIAGEQGPSVAPYYLLRRIGRKI
jgi:predicted nucleic acid-binding protein